MITALNIKEKSQIINRYYKKKQLRKQRSKIEGLIGNLKKDYSLEKIVLKTKQGAQIQASLAMGAFNMFRALKEI